MSNTIYSYKFNYYYNANTEFQESKSLLFNIYFIIHKSQMNFKFISNFLFSN